jgi:hypothetical protein
MSTAHEDPVVQAFAVVTEPTIGSIVRCGHESVERHRDVQNDLAPRFPRSATGGELVAGGRAADQPTDQTTAAERQWRKHELAVVAADLGLGSGPVVRPLLRETPYPRRHPIPPEQIPSTPDHKRAASAPIWVERPGLWSARRSAGSLREGARVGSSALALLDIAVDARGAALSASELGCRTRNRVVAVADRLVRNDR